MKMIIIQKEVIEDCKLKHPQSRKSLTSWELIISEADYSCFYELRQTFPKADWVHHQYTVFNIGGNNYRLITEIDYMASVIVTKIIWTHAEYSKFNNQDALRRGHL